MRTTGVRLIAELSQYKREMREGAQATRKVGDELDTTAVRGKKMGDGLTQVAKTNVRDFQEMTRHSEALRRKITETEAGIRSLAKGFANTGDVGILKEIGKQQRFLGQLKKVDNFLPKPAEVTAAGSRMGKQVATGMGDSLRSSLPSLVNPATIAVGAGMAAYLSPFLGAAVSGAVIGGAGVGGVVGGLLLAARDSRVQTAAQVVAGNLETRLNRAGGAFVVPAIRGLHELERALDAIDLEGLLGDSAEFVKPLVQGVAIAIRRIGTEFRGLIANARPAIDAISAGIAGVGDAVGDVLHDLQDNGVEAGVALRQTFQLVEGAIRAVGAAINFLTESYGVLAKLGLFGKDAQMQFIALEVSQKLATKSAKEYATAAGGITPAVEAAGTASGQAAGSIVKVKDAATQAAEAIDVLKEHTSELFSQQMSLDRANLAVRNGMVTLKAELVDGARTLSINTGEGRKNRGAVLDQLTAIDQLRQSRIKHGETLVEANRKYGKDIEGLRRSMLQTGYTKGAVDSLLGAYRKIPGDVETEVSATGIKAVQRQLVDLVVLQKALRKGVSMSAARAQAGDEASARDRNLFHAGGYTGRGGKYEPAGTVHRDEFVVRKESRQKIERQAPGLLDEMNATGQVPPGYARGGRAVWPFPTTAANARIPSRQEAMNAVIPDFGSWPSSPSAQRGDSGVWRRIVALIRSTGPMSGSFGNAYRPGDPKWHGSGRAVDWMGFNQNRLASFLAARRPLELIHRTNQRDYAYTRGRNMGSFNNALMEAHRNHVHIAMGDGGVIREHVVGVGASGRTYEFGERGTSEVVMPMTGGNGGGNAGGNTYYVTVNPTALASPRDIGREVIGVIQAYEQGSGARWRTP